MVFDQIADLERKKQGRSIDKIIDCCTELGLDWLQVEKDGSVSIPNTDFQVLVTEMFKINRGISSSIMKAIFEVRAEHPYNLWCICQFSVPLVSTVFQATESIFYLVPKIWSLLPENFKNIDSLENFKILIKKRKTENCPCRLCKVYIKNMGFLNNKKLCIISQDNI